MTDDISTTDTAPPEKTLVLFSPVTDNKGFSYSLVEKPLTIQDVKNNLTYFRIRAQFTQRDFAKAVGVSQALVSLWESPSDTNFFTADMRTKICKLLGCDEKYVDRDGLTFIYDSRAAGARMTSRRMVALHSPPINLQELKQNLTYYRVQAGMSQKQLAELIGVKQPVLATWESIRDKRLFPDKMLSELAKALSCPENDLDRHSFDFAIDANGHKIPNIRSSLGDVMTLQLPVRDLMDAKNNLRYYRKLRHMTLQVMGAYLGLVPSTISIWESDSDERFIPTTKINAVAKVLDCPPEHLIVDPVAAAQSVPRKQEPIANKARNDGSWALEDLGISPVLDDVSIIQSNAADLRLVAAKKDLALPVFGAKELPITLQEIAGIKSIIKQYACVRMLDDSMANYTTGAGLVSGDYAVIDTSSRDINECLNRITCIALPDNVLVVARIKIQDGISRLVFDNNTELNTTSFVMPQEATIVGRVVTVIRRL